MDQYSQDSQEVEGGKILTKTDVGDERVLLMDQYSRDSREVEGGKMLRKTDKR